MVVIRELKLRPKKRVVREDDSRAACSRTLMATACLKKQMSPFLIR